MSEFVVLCACGFHISVTRSSLICLLLPHCRLDCLCSQFSFAVSWSNDDVTVLWSHQEQCLPWPDPQFGCYRGQPPGRGGVTETFEKNVRGHRIGGINPQTQKVRLRSFATQNNKFQVQQNFRSGTSCTSTRGRDGTSSTRGRTGTRLTRFYEKGRLLCCLLPGVAVIYISLLVGLSFLPMVAVL